MLIPLGDNADRAADFEHGVLDLVHPLEPVHLASVLENIVNVDAGTPHAVEQRS
jgi:hypothetical protein